MELERGRLVSPIQEVPVVEGEIVTAIRELADRGWGSKAIAREPGVARNTVRRYRRQPIGAGQQMRTPRRLTADVVREAETHFRGVTATVLGDNARALGARTIGARGLRRPSSTSSGKRCRQRRHPANRSTFVLDRYLANFRTKRRRNIRSSEAREGRRRFGSSSDSRSRMAFAINSILFASPKRP